MTRRQFTGLIGLARKSDRQVTGSFVNESHTLGHRLRDRGAFDAPRQSLSVPIVIVGGGIGGLSAAWRLSKRNFRDFVLLEMDSQAGGNSRYGENEITRYPWAAHYIPVPGPKPSLALELLTDLGAFHGAKWEERYLCFTPQERLYLHGRWQEGIEPEIAATARDHQQYKRFNELIAEQRASGRFVIPIDDNAPASPLDAMSMRQWLLHHRLDSEYLNWYVDYACRDDYGAQSSVTSAFMGVHYFAARQHDEKGPLTWPEGNGWVVRALTDRLGPQLRTNSPVYRIERAGRKLRVFTPRTLYTADAVVFAAPSFLSRHLYADAAPVSIEYSPWVTANLTLDRLPRERSVEPAWDNVIYGSPSLGYVVATHQSIASHRERTVWTWYHALAGGTTSSQRRVLLERGWHEWKEFILGDLARAHPDIRECVSKVDVMRMGHAMARPVPGSMFSEARRKLARHPGPLFYANSDVSGYSIFEEAQYRGVRAADRALAAIS